MRLVEARATSNTIKTAEGAASNMQKATPTQGESPSRLIDARIKELNDWRGKTLSHVRALVKQAVPDVVEEWKWRGVPVWYHDGMHIGIMGTIAQMMLSDACQLRPVPCAVSADRRGPLSRRRATR